MANKKFTFANGEGYRVSVYAEDRYEAQEMAERKFKENGRSDYPVRMVPNSRACNALTPADEKKMCDIMKRYLNKPGDKVMLKTHEGLPNGMSRTTVEVFAAYQDDQRETPDYRIKAAKKAVMGAMRVPCVGDGTRPMNDGSFSGHLVFMNGESICSTDKVVANAVEYVGKHVENARVRIKHVGFLNKWLVRDPNMGSRQRAFDSDREAIKWAEENGHEWTVENSVNSSGAGVDRVKSALYNLIWTIHHPDGAKLPGTIAREIMAKKWTLEHNFGVKNLKASKSSKTAECDYQGEHISVSTY